MLRCTDRLRCVVIKGLWSLYRCFVHLAVVIELTLDSFQQTRRQTNFLYYYFLRIIQSFVSVCGVL